MELKDANKNYNLDSETFYKTKTKPKNNKTCHLCSLEKYETETFKKELPLNKSKERQQTCINNQNIYFKRSKIIINKKYNKLKLKKSKTKQSIN